MRPDEISVLFDLDGTLIDSSRDLTAAANVMLSTMGLQTVTLDQVETWIGHGLSHLIHRCLTREFHGVASNESFAEGIGLFRRAYLDTGFIRTRLLSGSETLLSALRSEGFMLGLVTNKDTIPTHAVLNTLELTAFFDVLVCGDSLPVKKPHPEPLRHAVRILDSRAAWMVGDSETDARSSHAAGIQFIAVQGGYGHSGRLEDLPGPPALVIESLDSLLQIGGEPVEMLSNPRALS
ncbi:MAG: phosphoglycolate phosphatase [Phycisphaerae bacterium]|nr:phosphoglycolate phosphatase [Phycisphaerae bacterium]HAW95386.1 phosphoglycolate phosphatase [Phycisphaerales bacterium]|tara:strand:+ start:50 stop:757 length:708 start_codon:yes stop_codon:yes gene_type:complete